MCADRALFSLGGIVNHLHNCDKIIYRPDSHNLLCRDFARDATPLVIIADEAPQVCLIICANWNFEREYFVPLDRLVFLVFRFTFEWNRSSPLYAICLNWITFLQCVGFDSNYSFTDVTVKSNRTGEHPTSIERFILPIKPDRSREFNPFHRKHHQASNASSERRSNKTASGWCFRCFASPIGKVLLLLPENAVSYPSNSRQCRNTTTATAYTMILKFLSSWGNIPHTVKGDRCNFISNCLQSIYEKNFNA